MSRYCNRSGELGQGCCLATHLPDPLPLSREGGAARGHCVQQTSWREKLSGLARRLVPKTSASVASRRCRNLWFLPGVRGCPPPLLVSRQVIRASFGGAGGEAPAGGLGGSPRYSIFPLLSF